MDGQSRSWMGTRWLVLVEAGKCGMVVGGRVGVVSGFGKGRTWSCVVVELVTRSEDREHSVVKSS